MLEPDTGAKSLRTAKLWVVHGLGWACLGVVCFSLVIAAGFRLFTQQSDLNAFEVTRASTDMIELPQPIRNLSPEPVAMQIQRPVRVTDTSAQAHDLAALVEEVLKTYDYSVLPGDRLHALLLQTLAERQTDEYIDATLDAALTKGEFELPEKLVAADGTADTDALLASLLDIATH